MKDNKDSMFWPGFVEYLARQNIAESSQKKYFDIAIFFMHNYDISNPDSIAQYLSEKRRYGGRFAIKHLLYFLNLKDVYDKFCDDYKHKFPWIPRKIERKHITKEQVARLVASLPWPYSLAAKLQYETALRCKALIELRVQDIYMDDNTDTYISVTEKGNRHYELYLLPDTAIQLLKAIASKPKESRVFTFAPQQYNTKLNTYGQAMFGFRISSHWLRTSRGIHLRDAGADPMLISSDVWHHKDIKTSQIYFGSKKYESKKIMQEFGGL